MQHIGDFNFPRLADFGAAISGANKLQCQQVLEELDVSISQSFLGFLVSESSILFVSENISIQALYVAKDVNLQNCLAIYYPAFLFKLLISIMLLNTTIFSLRCTNV